MARFGFRANPSLNRGGGGTGDVISRFVPSKIEALELGVGGGGGGKTPSPFHKPHLPNSDRTA